MGILLLPLCVAAGRAVFGLLKDLHSTNGSLIPLPAAAVLIGIGLWLLVYFLLPRPVRSYILAHELTHAIWAAILGERVLSMKVSRSSGSVTLSDSNFLITLAPYFFPLYTFLVMVAYPLAGLFLDMAPFRLVWLALVGFTWSFHVTFTIASLCVRQPDIRECGYVFSYALILLMNILVVGVGITAVSPARLEDFAGHLARASIETAAATVKFARKAAHFVSTIRPGVCTLN